MNTFKYFNRMGLAMFIITVTLLPVSHQIKGGSLATDPRYSSFMTVFLGIDRKTQKMEIKGSAVRIKPGLLITAARKTLE